MRDTLDTMLKATVLLETGDFYSDKNFVVKAVGANDGGRGGEHRVKVAVIRIA